MNTDQITRIKYLKAAYDVAIEHAPDNPFSVNINPIELRNIIGFDVATTRRVANWHVQNGYATSILGLKSFIVTSQGLKFIEQNPMNTENIIRAEAKEFYQRFVKGSRHAQPIDTFHEVKTRLFDFYSDDDKAIFLDEIQQNLMTDLADHRNSHHDGIPKPGCAIEDETEKLMFYIHQELDTYPTIAQRHIVDHPKFQRDKVFVCYSHADKRYLEEMQVHFKPFSKQMNLWVDTMIQPGQKWREEIRSAINQTKIAILLVSPEFLASDFISTDELPPLLKAAEDDGATILIVILKPCFFEGFPELSKYQTMNAPDWPVSKMDENEKADVFVNLIKQTNRILQ